MKNKSNDIRKNYYLFKMNALILNGVSVILILICSLIFYLIYENDSLIILNNNLNILMILYIPYLLLHELLHSFAYVKYGADFKNITYGIHLEKGILCCLCKQKISRKNILCSLLYPFIIIGIITLFLGVIFDSPLLVILSLVNITGCSGDLVMFYHLFKLKDFEFSEYNDPMAFAIYTSEDFSKLKLFGLDFVEKTTKIDRSDLRKVVISKASVIILIIFYILFTVTMFI